MSDVLVIEAGRRSQVGQLLVPRAGHTATVLPDGRVLIAGGTDRQGRPVLVSERLDPRTWQSEVVALPLTPRAGHSATVLTDGSVIFLGGRLGDSPVTNIDVWNPTTGEVRTLALGWDQPRTGHVADLQADGRVVVRGGAPAVGEGVLVDQVFAPATSSFTTHAGGESAARALPGNTMPADGSANVPLEVTPLVAFSAPVFAGPHLKVELSSGERTTQARIIWLERGRLVALVASTPLQPGTTYRAVLTGLVDGAGQPVPPVRVSFTTQADVPAPVPQEPGDESWLPRPGAWRTDRPASPWEQLPTLEAPEGVTALAGRVLLLNGRPLAGVTVTMSGQRTETDRTGRFLLRHVAPGAGRLLIDGRSASGPGRRYGVFAIRVQPVEGVTTPLGFTSWMPRLDERHVAAIPSPTAAPTVVTTPLIPGLELHLPAGAIIRDHEGHVVREVSITPIPVDRPPFPLPAGVQVPIYFTIQPGNGYLEGAGTWPAGARLIYPNYQADRPGARVNFWNYDPDLRGWHVYGLGTVDAKGQRVVPDPETQIYAFAGAMINTGQAPPPEGPDGREAGDPVDISTGLFVYRKTDLYLHDVLPLSLTRTYRSRDTTKRAFGIGASHPYAIFLWSANQYQEADLVQADGSRIHFVRISPGTGFTDAVFEHTVTPGHFYKSRITWTGQGWHLTTRDGTAYQFGDVAPLQSITDRYGNTISLTWSTVNGSGSGDGTITRISSSNGRWIEFDYDTADRITQARDNLGRSVQYVYDAGGRLWKVTDAAGGLTEYTYDSADRMLTIKDPRGIVFLTNQYDANGRVTLQTQADSTTFQFAYTLDGSGRVVQTDVTNPRGYVDRSVFNTEGYEVSFTEAVGTALARTTTYTRHATSQRLEAIVDPLNRRTEFTYDDLGNLTSLTRLAGTANAVTTAWTYEPLYQQVATITDPLAHTTTFGYDASGRLNSVTNALSRQWSVTLGDGGLVASVTDPLSQTTQFEYAAGVLAATVNGLGRRVSLQADAAGRRVSVRDPLGHPTTIAYTALSQVSSIVDAKSGQTSFTYDGNGNLLTLTDPRSGVTTYTYDTMDRVATRTDPVTQAETYLYDANGNLREVTDRKGQTTTFTYDALDRLATATYDDSSTATYTYDAGDRLTQIVDTAAGTITRSYDDLDRLTSETTAQGMVSYAYDAAGRRTSMTASGQAAVTYGYDNADQLTSVTQGTTTVTLGYDLAGRRSSLVLPNGITTAYGYDAASQLTSLTWTTGAGTLGDLTYTYDEAGRPTRLGGTFARTNVPPALSSATYDLANRIQTWAGTTFSYDLNGNLTSDGSATYTWNARDQLTAVSGANPGSFTYDASGRRKTRAVGGVTTNYLYDGLDAVQEQVGGSASANYLLGLGIDERFARTDGTGTSWYLPDALQSTLALADATGTVQTSYTYEPYGATTQSGAGSANPARYTGREEDGTGLYYYRARYYDARRQRFVSEDSLGFNSGDLNFYRYVYSSPAMFSDPTGYYAGVVLPLAGCIGGMAGAAGGNWMAGRKFDWPDLVDGCGMGAGIGMGAAAAASGAGAAAGASGARAGAGAAARNATKNAAKRGRSRNKLRADPNAQGPHSTYKRDPVTGKVTHYETYQPNPRNPRNPWDSVKRYDGTGDSHYNKATGQDIPTPHVHDPSVPGGVRLPLPGEIPK